MSSLNKAKLNKCRRKRKQTLPTHKSKLKARIFLNMRRAGIWENQRRVEHLAVLKIESKSLTTVFQGLHNWWGSYHFRTAPNDTGHSSGLGIFQSVFLDSVPRALGWEAGGGGGQRGPTFFWICSFRKSSQCHCSQWELTVKSNKIIKSPNKTKSQNQHYSGKEEQK